jgi:hypothetical protein
MRTRVRVGFYIDGRPQLEAAISRTADAAVVVVVSAEPGSRR